MKRLVWRGSDGLHIEHSTAPVPIPGDGEVLVKVRGVGICGTDIHILRGTLPFAKPPLVLGHEISGEIAAVGPNIDDLEPGDRVTVDAVVGCGHCSLCARRAYQFCAETFEHGITRDGGCQEYLVLPRRNVYSIADSISFEEAAILDMEVYNAVCKCGVARGDKVLVLGAGPIGLIACQVARILGAGPVTLCDVLPGRVQAAEARGMANAYVTPETIGPHRECFEVVIDCAGTAQSVQFALEASRLAGRVLFYGVHEQPIESFDLNQIVLKDLVVFGAQSDRNGWKDVIDLVSTGALNLKSLVTHRFTLEEGPRAYELVSNREEAVIKAVLLL